MKVIGIKAKKSSMLWLLEVDPDTGDIDVHCRRSALSECRLSFDAESLALARQLIMSIKGVGGLKIIVR